jgi:hypothetical protein
MKDGMQNVKCVLFAAVLLVLASVPDVGRAEDDLSSVSGFESFRIVLERNIFDPNRRPLQPEDFSVPKEPPADRVALIGVLISEGGAVAFFESPKPEYNLDVKQGETIAGFQVAGIRTDYLTLVRDGRQMELPVGSSLSKQDDGEWELSSEGLPFSGSESTSISGETGVTEGSTETQSSGSSTSDLIRKLKERRRQEMGE